MTPITLPPHCRRSAGTVSQSAQEGSSIGRRAPLAATRVPKRHPLDEAAVAGGGEPEALHLAGNEPGGLPGAGLAGAPSLEGVVRQAAEQAG